ncbi:MAG: phosphonopyruvate decarboxylase [Alphaproteobacteria bacterium]|nr:phosphonopyruvate decarboxylase [Alphaproteobacteria bacterium]
MIAAQAFLGPAVARGFDFYTGVPCSFLTPVINAVISDRAINYVGAANEGEAVAIAAGAWLAGRRTVVMCQNSGLGNTVNPLTSLNFPFRIPTLMVVTWRGQPGLKDEPQHELMGQVTGALLKTMRIPYGVFPDSEEAVAGALDDAEARMDENGLPFAFIMEKGAVRDDGLNQVPVTPPPAGTHHDLRTKGQRPTRAAALERFLAFVPAQAGVIATTGKCGRELFTLDDRDAHLYQVGSMGCASAMGLGVALNTTRPVVVLDGDGAALMHMGNLATIGAQGPKTLVHILLDNGVHDSTGGQATVSPVVNFAEAALACGYAAAWSCDDLVGFEHALQSGFAHDGPALIHLRIAPGSMENLGRPTVKPPEVAARFKSFLVDG